MATSAAYIDLTEGAAPAAPAAGKVRVYVKTDGLPYSKDDAGAESGLVGSGAASNLASGVSRITAADYTGLASTTFADVDATNAKVTITTGARRVLVTVSAVCAITTATQTICLDIDVDGTRIGQAFGIAAGDATVSGRAIFLGFSVLTDALSAGSHTFKLKYRVTGSTATIYATAAVAPLIISAVEQYAA